MTHPIVLAGSAASNTEVVTFWVLAVIAVGAALGMILTRRAWAASPRSFAVRVRFHWLRSRAVRTFRRSASAF